MLPANEERGTEKMGKQENVSQYTRMTEDRDPVLRGRGRPAVPDLLRDHDG